ncbi:hypothetical protein BLNAU_14535 [Blattamonas nauphoetae]|uniref:Protein kinase domain-containing protein n=1 Tax=Blattamonas nauphoetae TaxID=2049346 RepID=A0ABQ9XDH3_9EUKA|nr:hypothetical protein BLNAU_14535 [Blattamonas nauphoetae]
MRVDSGQSPFVVTGRQEAENSEETLIYIVASVLLSSDSIIGATASILADSGNLGLSVSVMSCDMDSTRIGSWNGLLVDRQQPATSNTDMVKIETLLSDCRLENVTGAPTHRYADGGSKLWSQRLLSNSISNSSSVLSGTVIRDFNDGGDLLCANTTITSCSTSTVPQITRNQIEASILHPYILPNLRRHTSKDGKYEWKDSAFGQGTVFDFYDYSRQGARFYDMGVNFFFSTRDDSIHFTRCHFSYIDGTDSSDGKYRGASGTAILVRCPSSLLVEHCTFESCYSSVFSGAIHIEMEHQTPSLTILSSSFLDCYSGYFITPSTITQFSLGPTTIHDCRFTHSTSVENIHAISSEAIIASNCQFSIVDHPSNPFAFIICRTHADFRCCSFNSLTQLDFDAESERPWAISYLGCVSNSKAAESGVTFGLFTPTIGEEEDEVVAEGSLSSTLTDYPSAETIFVGAGDFGEFEISTRRVTLKGWQKFVPASSSSSFVTELSGRVQTDGDCHLSNLHLAPPSTRHSIVLSNGVCSLTGILIDGIDNQTVPLFVFSGQDAFITVIDSKFRNIHNDEATLIEVNSGATFSLDTSIFQHISLSASVISVLQQGSISVSKTSFTDINTTGSGPAALDIESPKSVYFDSPFFHQCCSDQGEAGAIRLVTSSTDPLEKVNLFCLTNRGADNAPTDILFDGLSKEECESFLSNSKHFGVGPHFGWKNGEDVGTADTRQQDSLSFELCSFPGFATQVIDDRLMLRPSDLEFSTLLNRITPSSRLHLSVTLHLETNLVQKPFELDKKSILLSPGYAHRQHERIQLEQALSEDVSLAVLKNRGSLDLYALIVLVDSRNTAAMFIVTDETSTLSLITCIVVGDDGSVHRPFIQSQGQVSLNEIHFCDMNFGSRSCIELNGGYFFCYSGSRTWLMTSAINLTTTGNGAFLSSTNQTGLVLGTLSLINCSAQSGGALFLEEPREVSLSTVHFVGCSARDDGGAVKVIDETGRTEMYLRMDCVNCTARRGGGLFLFLNERSTVRIETLTALDNFGPIYQNHTFENCIAEQGGGIFIDGNSLPDTFRLVDVSFNNWNTIGLGTDMYFGEGLVVEQVESLVAELHELCPSMSRQSTDLSKLCHVHIAGSSPPRSFNLQFPKIILKATDSDILSPLARAQVNHFFEIVQYVHCKDEEGQNLKTEIIIKSSFYLSERGYCTDQILSFISDPDEEENYPVSIKHDGNGPLEEHVVLEIRADATIEFHDLIILVQNPAQMMLLTDTSAEGLVDGCSFKYDPAPGSHVLIDVALFEVVDGTLTLKNTIFTLDGDEVDFGADDFFVTKAPFVLVSPSTSLSASPTVIMDNLTFQRMRLGDGVEALMVFDVSASVSVNDLKFVECNQPNTEEATQIAVTGSNLERVDVSKWNGFSFLTPTDTLNVGMDRGAVSGSIWKVFPLRVLLIHFTNTTIKTEVSGRDLVGCGEGKWSCRGLIRAGKNLGGDTTCTISVVESSFLDGVFDPATKLTSVHSSGSKSTIVVSKEGVIVNSPDGGQPPFLTLTRLSFSLPPSLDSDSLMKSLGGELKIDTCWFVSSSPIDFSLLSATGGIATIENIVISELQYSSILIKLVELESATVQSVKLADLNDVTLFSAEGTPDRRWTLTITKCSFKGSETERNEEQDENKNLCTWGSGAFELKNCNSEVSWTTFSHLRQGAIHATNSNVTFQQSSLTNNGISTGLFPSARQNIRCVGASRIVFETSPVGAGEEKNAWVSGDSECVVEGVVGEERKLFFEPTLDSSSSSSTLNKKEKKYEVSIVGTTLIPCGLSLEVFVNEDSSTKRVLLPLSEIASEWNETSLSLVIPTTRLSSLSNTPQWLGRISFGGQYTTDSFEMKLSAKMARANELKKTLPWLIPLIVVLSILVVVGIVLVVCCRRRKQKTPTNASEMEPQLPVEDEKMDELIHTPSHPPNSALSTLNSKRISAEDQQTQLPPVSIESSISLPAVQYIEALTCAGKLEMALVRKQDTLYARLHTEQGRKMALTTESVRQQLLRGIQNVWETDRQAPILTKLSSHVVMVDFASNVFLNINSDATIPENAQNKQATLLEQKRWSAPELDEETGQNSAGEQKEIDYSKAAVFSLGLILWELETGLVPFGEVDAMNAQRQLGVGSTLKMEGIKDETMKDAISQCISLNAKDRPTLAELNELINPKKDFPPLPSNCSDS